MKPTSQVACIASTPAPTLPATVQTSEPFLYEAWDRRAVYGGPMLSRAAHQVVTDAGNVVASAWLKESGITPALLTGHHGFGLEPVVHRVALDIKAVGERSNPPAWPEG